MSGPQRTGERVPILGDLLGEIMVFQPMVIREISRGGANIETGTPLILNSLHDLRLTLGDTSLVLKARVVHSHISDVDQDVVRYRSGVEFVQPSAEACSVIDEFLAAIKAQRSGV